MAYPQETGRLPTFIALEALPVLAGTTDAASIQLTTTYCDNRIAVLTALDDVPDNHTAGLRETRETVGTLDTSVDTLEIEPLLGVAEDLQERLAGMPEVAYLRTAYPGDCVIIPEFLRTESRIQFGPRLYFFRSGEAPAPTDLIRRNVTALVEESQRGFEDFQGELHGYPACCIEQFTDHRSASPSPERRAVAPLESRITDTLIGGGPSVSIQQVVTDLFDTEDAYAFFSRKFFPEPACETARTLGHQVFETLTTEFDLPPRLVRDAVRLNVAHCYHLAETLPTGPGEPPEVGDFGREHLYSYLPLQAALTVSRYE